MPDLNLIDEGGFEDAPAQQAAAPAKKKMPKSGGGGGKILLVVLLLLIIGGTVWFLNQRGIVKLWGKKKAPVVQMEEEPLQEQGTEEQASGQAAVEQPQADTGNVELVETPPVDEKTETQKMMEETDDALEESAAGSDTESSSLMAESSKLSEMKGEFTVQVGAYRDKNSAVEIAENLEIAGYPSFVEKAPIRGNNWYTVRIGKYETREAAEKAVKNFAAELRAHYVIDKVRGN